MTTFRVSPLVLDVPMMSGDIRKGFYAIICIARALSCLPEALRPAPDGIAEVGAYGETKTW